MVPLAPNPTKVMLYIAEREQMGSRINVQKIKVNTLKGLHKEPEYMARNPFGTLPILELEDGSYLRESLTIIDYLEEKFPDCAMRPTAPEENAKVRELERIIELKLANPIGGYVHAKKSPLGFPPDQKKASDLRAVMPSPLNFLETLLSDGRPLLAGDNISVADCTLAAFLQFARFIEEDLLTDWPALRRWDKTYRKRPAAQAVLKW